MAWLSASQLLLALNRFVRIGPTIKAELFRELGLTYDRLSDPQASSRLDGLYPDRGSPKCDRSVPVQLPLNPDDGALSSGDGFGFEEGSDGPHF